MVSVSFSLWAIQCMGRRRIVRDNFCDVNFHFRRELSRDTAFAIFQNFQASATSEIKTSSPTFSARIFFFGEGRGKSNHGSSRHHFHAWGKTEFMEKFLAVVPRKAERPHVSHAEAGDDG